MIIKLRHKMRPQTSDDISTPQQRNNSSHIKDHTELSIDGDISRWILQFLLRQNLDNAVLKSILATLPVSNQDSELKKAILLRGLQEEISTGSISEKVLEYMEFLARLAYAEGSALPESLADAYSAVVVQCAKNCSGVVKGNSAKFFDAVERIINERIDARGSGKSDPIWKKMKNWLCDIETAILDNSVCEFVFNTEGIGDALGLVKVYLKESWEKMGPSVLDLAAANVEEMGSSIRQRKETENGDLFRTDGVGSFKRLHAEEGKVPERLVENVRSKEQKCLPSVEVNKIRDDLKSSFLDLREVVKDPLPEALRFSESVANKIGECSTGDSGGGPSRSKKGVPQPSLMARNHTACSYEWDDSAERPHLPSPRNVKMSPLKSTKFVLRRKKTKWSVVEEETLLHAVRKYGRGNWKLILDMHRDIFEERTEVDLKDKWRNMVKK